MFWRKKNEGADGPLTVMGTAPAGTPSEEPEEKLETCELCGEEELCAEEIEEHINDHVRPLENGPAGTEAHGLRSFLLVCPEFDEREDVAAFFAKALAKVRRPFPAEARSQCIPLGYYGDASFLCEMMVVIEW